MSAYNILAHKIQCNNCSRWYHVNIQFKFGDTWQHVYNIGDSLVWNGNDIGKRGSPNVKVYGIAETSVCPYCDYANDEEFDILVKNNILIEVKKMENINNYFIDSDGNYYIRLLP